MTTRIHELKTLLAEQPSAREFVELARLLSKSENTRAEARDVLFKGIVHHPSNYVARLLLARLFFQDHLYAYAARELAELWSLNKSETVKKLLLSFGDYGKNYLDLYQGNVAKESNADVLAEIDLDEDFADALSEIGDEDDE